MKTLLRPPLLAAMFIACFFAIPCQQALAQSPSSKPDPLFPIVIPGDVIYGGIDAEIISTFPKLGYIDSNGKVVVDPWQVAGALDDDHLFITEYLVTKGHINDWPLFYDGRCLSREEAEGDEAEGKVGFIDVNHNFIKLPEGYTYVLHDKTKSHFTDGRIAVQYGERYGFADRNGRICIPPTYDWVEPFSEGLALVFNEKLGWGFIDTTGRYVILPEPPPDDLVPYLSFYDGRAYAIFASTIPGEVDYGYIDRTGKVVVKFSNDQHFKSEYMENMAACAIADYSRYGFIDRNGHWAIKPSFTDVRPFHDGMAAAKHPYVKDKWGFINQKGNFVIVPHTTPCATFLTVWPLWATVTSIGKAKLCLMSTSFRKSKTLC